MYWWSVLSLALALKRVTDCLVAAPVPVCAHVHSCMIMPEETRDPDHSGRSTRHRAGGGVCVRIQVEVRGAGGAVCAMKYVALLVGVRTRPLPLSFVDCP